MPCRVRQLTGSCRHDACPYPDESGVECVDIDRWGDWPVCERVGGCRVKRCEYNAEERGES